jgi:hypothetical protein
MTILDQSDVVHTLLQQRDKLVKSVAAMDSIARVEQARYADLVARARILVGSWGDDTLSAVEQDFAAALEVLDTPVSLSQISSVNRGR